MRVLRFFEEGCAVIDHDDAYLVQRAQDGFVDAYEDLVRRHSASTYRVALRLLGDHHEAEDAAQEALITGWQRLATFRGQSSFGTWMYRIVTRVALNRIRRGPVDDSLDLLAAADRVPPAPPTTRPDHLAQQHATVDAVTRAIVALPPAQRIVIVLFHFENLPYADIAQVTGSTEPAIRSHLFRARRTLASTLAEWR